MRVAKSATFERAKKKMVQICQLFEQLGTKIRNTRLKSGQSMPDKNF